MPKRWLAREISEGLVKEKKCLARDSPSGKSGKNHFVPFLPHTTSHLFPYLSSHFLSPSLFFISFPLLFLSLARKCQPQRASEGKGGKGRKTACGREEWMKRQEKEVWKKDLLGEALFYLRANTFFIIFSFITLGIFSFAKEIERKGPTIKKKIIEK